MGDSLIDPMSIFIFIFGWIGLLSSILFYINPFFTIFNIFKGKQDIKKLTSGFDLLSIFFTTMFWSSSDFISGKDFTISSDKFSQNNNIGMILTFIALCIYLFYYSSTFVREDQKIGENGITSQVRVYKTNYFKFILFVIALIDVTVEIFYGAYIAFYLQFSQNADNESTSESKMKYAFKGFACGINLLMYIPSWMKITKAIREHKAEELSLPGYILGLIRYGSWVGYGACQFIHNKKIKTRDHNDFTFVMAGNLTFFVVCAIILGLYIWKIKKKKEPVNRTNNSINKEEGRANSIGSQGDEDQED